MFLCLLHTKIRSHKYISLRNKTIHVYCIEWYDKDRSRKRGLCHGTPVMKKAEKTFNVSATSHEPMASWHRHPSGCGPPRPYDVIEKC